MVQRTDGSQSIFRGAKSVGRVRVLNVLTFHEMLVAIGLPLVLYLIVRPDWYYRLNGLDSYFYTGYAQNLGDALAISGQRHYFVSRWSLYLPNRLFFKLFGASLGFLALRWVLASVIAACVLIVCRRYERLWNAMALVVIVLLSPILLRALLGDYADSVTVPAGVVALAAASVFSEYLLTGVVVGICAGVVVVANPIAGLAIVSLVPLWLWNVRTWSLRLRLFCVACGSAGLVLISGWALFRIRYGLANVYAPTVRFMKDHASYNDPLKSAGLSWMQSNLWIYIPLLVMLIWAVMERRSPSALRRQDRVVLGACGLQYAFQVSYQFLRNGSTLEIPYYWSMIAPSLLLSVVVILGSAGRGARSAILPSSAALVFGWALAFRSSMPVVYRSWVLMLGCMLALAFVCWATRRQLPHLGLFVIPLALFSLQVGSPSRKAVLDPVNASYETVFSAQRSDGIDGYRAATWFSSRMRSLDAPLRRSAFFWIGGSHAHQMAAMSGAHVSGRWMNSGWGNDSIGLNLTRDFQWAVDTGVVNVIVMAGTVGDVATMVSKLNDLRPGYITVFNEIAPDRLRTVVRVVRYQT